MDEIILAPDQQVVDQKIIDVFRSGERDVFVQAATGFGKSYLATNQMRRSALKGKTIYYCVPRLLLMSQISELIGLPHSLNEYTAVNQAQIFTMQKLVTLMHDIPPPDVLYVDEAHYGGDTLDEIVLFYKSRGVYCVFLSATPETLKGKGFLHWTTNMVQSPPVRWLIDNKRLSDYEICHAPQAMESGQIYGDIATEWRKHASGLRTLGFCVDRKHAETTTKQIQTSGIRTDYIDGTMHDSVIRAKIEAFASRDIEILLSVALVNMGFDLEQYVKRKCTVEAMIDLAKTNSLALQMQKWGRVLRMKERPAVILDFVGNVHTHDKPCIERHWSLGGAPARKRLEQGKDVYARLCESCHGHYNATKNVCPYCGCVPTPQAREIVVTKGELVKMEAIAKKETLKAMNKQDGLRGVVRYAIMQGYSNPVMWVAYKYGHGNPPAQLIRELQGYYDEITRN